MPPQSPYVFISHSKHNLPLVEEIDARLEAAHIATWLDVEDIDGGTRWVRELENAIQGCAAMLVVMSRAARDSEWVEREALFAMQAKKPVQIALIEDVPLPLHLLTRQFTDLHTDFEVGMARLIEDLREVLADSNTVSIPDPTPSPLPNEDNFFAYLAQLPDGDTMALAARNLYTWAQQHADEVEFGGKHTPGFHVRIKLGDKGVTVFSVLAYMRNPAVQVPFDYLAKYAPYVQTDVRLQTLTSLNQLMPPDDQFEPSRADRRPTLPLLPIFAQQDNLTFFKQLAQEIIDNLRQQQA